MTPIYLCSRSRFDIFDPKAKSSTWNSIKGLGKKIYIVVNNDQYLQYKLSAKKHKQAGFEFMTVEPKGLTYKRSKVAEHALKKGYTKLITRDDDLKFFTRASQEKLKMSTKKDMLDMINQVEKDLDTCSQVGLSMRLGNNRYEGDFAEFGRISRFIGYKVEPYNKVEHRMRMMQDFDINLQMLKMGLKSKIWYRWAHDDRTNAKGGCSDYRTVKSQGECAEELARLHPDVVQVVQKNNLGAYGKRKDVRVQWKKAKKG